MAVDGIGTKPYARTLLGEGHIYGRGTSNPPMMYRLIGRIA